MQGDERVVDAHVHFWDRTRMSYPWLEDVDGLASVYRHEDLLAANGGAELAGVVVVQADCVPE